MSLEHANNAERAHMLQIKLMDCGVCGEAGPSDAHHITDCGRRVSHFATIPLCKTCHAQVPNGSMWRIHKKTELLVLTETIGKMKGYA